MGRWIVGHVDADCGINRVQNYGINDLCSFSFGRLLSVTKESSPCSDFDEGDLSSIGAGVDDGCGLLLAGQHDEQVGHQGCLGVGVEMHHGAFVQQF